MATNEIKIGEQGMARWWEHSSPTNVAQVQILASTPYVGWVCCWFSPLLWEVFLRVLRFSVLPPNHYYYIILLLYYKDGGRILTGTWPTPQYTPPSPNRASLSMNAAPYMYMYFSLTTCTVRLYIISKAIEVSYLMHMTYTTSIKQQTLSKSGFSWVYMCRYTNISDSWDILLFNRRKLKKKTLSKTYLQ